MAIARPLTKPLLKKLFLKTLHEHRRPGGKCAGNAWSITQVLGTIPYVFGIDKLTDAEMALGRARSTNSSKANSSGRTHRRASSEFKALTAKGLSVVEQELDDMRLPSVNIDELISRDELRDKVRDDFISGDYESAIFKAFRLLEESARKKAGQPASAIGVNLMTTVFKPGAALLKHPEAQVASEEEALFYLMRGAIGWFKNPSSHRTVGYDDAVQAAHILAFANLLLDLLDQCHP